MDYLPETAPGLELLLAKRLTNGWVRPGAVIRDAHRRPCAWLKIAVQRHLRSAHSTGVPNGRVADLRIWT